MDTHQPMDVVILAGGGGTRLHPLSTPERPKPFLPLVPPEPDGRVPTLLQRTVARLLDGPDPCLPGPERLAVVVADRYVPLVRAQLPDVAVVGEPAGRNTAPAIALAALLRSGDPDDVMVVLPADHVIGDEHGFRRTLAAAADLARGAFGIGSPLVTLGIRPDRPATEYGYLVPDAARMEAVAAGTGHRLDASPLLRFEEKPTAERAVRLLEEPGTAWNAGMFLWRRRAIVDALETFAPDVIGPIREGLAEDRLADAYDAVRATSIDFAVMEPAAADGRVVSAAMDVGWSDLGGWTALLAAVGATGSGRVVQPGEPATVGPDDLVVRRRDGRLVVEAGPVGGILDPDGPAALLSGAGSDRPLVESLLDRCSPREATA
jgi:mannose-1-phosphate guanylyltransferase